MSSPEHPCPKVAQPAPGILPRYGYEVLKPVAHIELSGDLSGNHVGNLTRKSAGFPVWACMVKEALTAGCRGFVLSSRKSLTGFPDPLPKPRADRPAPPGTVCR